MAFLFFEDFKLHDEKGQSYRIDIERHSSFSHGHSKILEDGKYHILLNGNKHFFMTPPLRDFRLELDFSMIQYNPEFGYGIIFYFRYDRKLKKGHELVCRWTKQHLLQIGVDGVCVYEKQYDAIPDFSARTAVFELTDMRGRLSFMEEDISFVCPERSDLPQKGEVGTDLVFAPSSSMTISKIRLDSDDPLPKQRLGRKLEFVLSGVQGCTEPVRYSVEVNSYGDGYAEVDCVLAGTIHGRGKRINSGGRGWCYELDRLTRPYIRIESAGKEYKNILFANEMMLLMDPDEGRLCRKLFPNIPWPLHLTLVCRDFPQEYIVAAGYEHLLHEPWAFAENGPYEQIRGMDGKLIFEGDSLRGRNVSIRVKSPEDKLITSRIPKGIPEYKKALKHAREQHYFYDDETVCFEYGIFFRKEFYDAKEFSFFCEVQDPYGRAVPGVMFDLTDADWKFHADFFACISKRIILKAPLPSGVYHLKVIVKAGFKPLYDDCIVFEVLPEAEDAPPPPIASGMPMILSMNNEIKNLETDAFDPLGDFGGCGHYYSMVMRYPVIGKKLKIWEILKVYHRKWFLMLTTRNTADTSLGESNTELIRHADYLDQNERLQTFPQFIFLCPYYSGFVLRSLKEFILEKKPELKLTTPEIIDSILAEAPEKGYLSCDQLEEIVEKCWEEWVEFKCGVIERENKDFVEKILAINPKIARGGYGPFGLYVANYKSAYSIRLGRNGQRVDPVTNANGSFFFLEDYHLSCDYPITRPSFFVASYKLLYPEGRKLYPEIYYGGGVGCNDGAVYQAHPPYGIYEVYDSHQRRIVYTFGYATPFYKDGKYDYWRDYGFHCPTPPKNALRHFLCAWGNLLRNSPAKQLSAPFLVADPLLFKLHGDYFEGDCAYNIPTLDSWGDVCNTAEEAIAYSFMELSADGFNTPVQTLLVELGSLTKEMAPFLVLPPIVKGVSEKILESIRAAHERGIHLLAFESVCGLEDLFGVSKRKEKINIRSAGNETFYHKCANALYEADGAVSILNGSAVVGEKENIPLVLTYETQYGRTAFFNIPPTVVRREDYRQKLGFGEATISESMREAMKNVAGYLAPFPDVKTERGAINACISVNGDVIVTLSEDSPCYGDLTDYPVAFRFRIAFPGIENASIEADAPYSIAEKGSGFIVIRTETEKDTGLFFRFIPQKKG